MSSRLTSIADADVLLHLPGRTAELTFLEKGAKLKASILKQYFISKYLDWKEKNSNKIYFWFLLKKFLFLIFFELHIGLKHCAK